MEPAAVEVCGALALQVPVEEAKQVPVVQMEL
jgi:hypothetical protein